MGPFVTNYLWSKTAMGTLEWREESDGTFAAETACFSLMVHRTADLRHARFLIMSRREAGPDQLAGSGSRDTIGEAMTAAETAAA